MHSIMQTIFGQIQIMKFKLCLVNYDFTTVHFNTPNLRLYKKLVNITIFSIHHYKDSQINALSSNFNIIIKPICFKRIA